MDTVTIFCHGLLYLQVSVLCPIRVGYGHQERTQSMSYSYPCIWHGMMWMRRHRYLRFFVCPSMFWSVYVVYNTCTTQNYMDLAPTLGCPCFLAWLSIFEGINSMWILERLKDIMCWRNKGRANKCNKTRKEGKRSEAAHTEFLFMHPSQKLYMAIMLSGVFY